MEISVLNFQVIAGAESQKELNELRSSLSQEIKKMLMGLQENEKPEGKIFCSVFTKTETAET